MPLDATAKEPVRVSDAAVRIASGHDSPWLWVTYDLGGWVASVRSQPHTPWDGPEEVHITLDESDSGIDAAIDSAEASGGITAEVLRSVPLGDARKVLRRLRADALMAEAEEAAEIYDLPARMTSLEDWIAFARAYAHSAAANPLQPMVHLERATKLSPNTLAARVRRVRELGLLVVTGSMDDGTPWLVLGGAARYSDRDES